MNLDCKNKTNEIITWLRQTVQNAGFSRVVIAVSGGVDSAVSLNLAVKALGKDNVYALLLPYGKMSTTALEHGKLVTQKAGLDKEHILVKDIQSAVDVISNEVRDLKNVEDFSSATRNDKILFNVRQGNVMARIRMIYLFDLAKELGALVVGTENESEHYLGYFTRFGDEASDIEPIRSLYKTQVWEMAKYLGIPKEIIEKQPSANLWEGQSDEGEFGFTYIDADKILYMHYKEGKRNGDIVAAGIPEKIVRQVLEYAAKNAFKHKVPYIKN